MERLVGGEAGLLLGLLVLLVVRTVATMFATVAVLGKSDSSGEEHYDSYCNNFLHDRCFYGLFFVLQR